MLNKIIKIDLHIHSKDSEYKDGPHIVKDSNISNIDILVKKLETEGINLFAITDHNRFNYELYSSLKNRIKDSDIVNNILPGIEFDVVLEDGCERCHIVVIFDDSDQTKLKELWSKIELVRVLGKNDDFYSCDEFDKILKGINLKACLIVHQKQALNNSTGKTQSLSNSTSEPLYFMKIGYIDGLEYNHSRNEGIVKNSLREVNFPFPLITGSDCHQWSAYPYRSEGMDTEREFTEFKCLPTFKGLLLSLTSFSSRANRKENTNKNFISSINIKEKIIPLANGLNAIIGDNGSGKSLLANILSGSETKPYYRELAKHNDLEIIRSEFLSKDQIRYVDQGEIVKKVREGTLFPANEYYNDIDTIEEFKGLIIKYFNNLIKFLKKKVSLNKSFKDLNESTVEIRITQGENFHPIVDSSLDVSDNIILKDRIDGINKIISLLEVENKDYEDFYKEEKLDTKLEEIHHQLNEIHEFLSKKQKLNEAVKKVKQTIIKKLSDYNGSLSDKRTSLETKRGLIKQEYIDFKKVITAYIKEINKINMFPSFPKPISGHSTKSKGSYNFDKTTNYHNENVKDSFYNTLFNSGYRSEESIKSITTKEEISKALSQHNYDEIEKFKENKLMKFIQSWSQEVTSISEVQIAEEVGNTPGEISLVYYKFHITQSSKDYDVMIIDQPEDDINPKRINEFLLNHLASVRDSKQVILVTHNPMLVINLDVDNVIYINKLNDKFEVKSGCLEFDNSENAAESEKYSMLNLVKENLDGGYNVIERRLKSYDRD